jgi:hypothetical protein
MAWDLNQGWTYTRYTYRVDICHHLIFAADICQWLGQEQNHPGGQVESSLYPDMVTPRLEDTT